MKPPPPLKAITAFESALRHRSFSMAAAELNVTPGAIGQQVRKLEDWLGVRLFIRRVREVEPTPDALAYWARIQPALTELSQASWGLRAQRSNGVWLTMPPTLAARWFARRLPQFLAAHPTLAIHLSSATTMTDFDSETIDLAIRYFDGHAPQLDTLLLHPDEARVYCSPAYARKMKLKRPADVARTTLLHNTLHPHWERWLAAFAHIDIGLHPALSSVHFDQSLMTIDAAVRGQGLVLTSPLLAEEELQVGTLIEPFPKERLTLEKGYYLVHRRGASARPAVEILKRWLIAETASFKPAAQ
ncbi:LysR substrate-binding domain-containing protein [Alcaligenaceae bacterium B3P038]|nr:LysR substrate-binding domain-containing protein [Alcaligenaceae bacterium B3P038]